MNAISDTIAAVSTAPGEGAIAIIRLSGPESIPVADRIFRCSAPLPSERPAPAVIYGHVVSGTKIIDEALLLVMRAPHSYTREDVVEIQCHGGSLSAKRILGVILRQKVRLAEPGEFTRRAFLNGRLDLLQAEAVMDLISAQTERGAALAVEQLEGLLSNSFTEVYDNILGSCADLEATLDFIEDELPDSFMPAVTGRLADALNKIDYMIGTWDEGHIIREGALVVISGKPNAGKSTLLNALLGRDRVIVSPIPGTTRDVIEEKLVINGIPIRLVDTAGLRESECSLEQDGVRRAKNQIEKADLNLHVIDASKTLDTDYENMEINMGFLDPVKTIIVFNKIDLGFKADPGIFKKHKKIQSQLAVNKGVTEIKSAIVSKLGIRKVNLHQFVISERHKQILIASRSDLVEAIEMIKSGDETFIVPAVSKLKNVLENISMAIGKKYHHDLLDLIFNRFCIGK